MSNYDDPYDRPRRHPRQAPMREEQWEESPRRPSRQRYDDEPPLNGRRAPAPEARNGHHAPEVRNGHYAPEARNGAHAPVHHPRGQAVNGYEARLRQDRAPHWDMRAEETPPRLRDYGSPLPAPEPTGRDATLSAGIASLPTDGEGSQTLQASLIRTFKLLVFALFFLTIITSAFAGGTGGYMVGETVFGIGASVYFAAIIGFFAGAVGGFVLALLVFGFLIVMFDVREQLSELRELQRRAQPDA